jgi:hypothetical protein
VSHQPAAAGPEPTRGAGAPAGRGAWLALGTALVVLLVLPAMQSASARSAPVPASTPAAAPRSAEPPPGSVGIRLVDIPAATADDPRTREYVVDHLQPGVVIERRIEISNTTGEALTVAVYGAAAAIEDDAFQGAAGRAENVLTSWTSISAPTVTVPPGGAVLDTVTISVPEDAAPEEHYGVIWAEVGGATGGNVALVARTGIRVYLSVGGDNPPASRFEISSITAGRDPDGAATVTASVENTGGRALDLTGSLALASVTGALAAGPYPVSDGTTLAPGATGDVRIDIADDLAAGPWTATVELHSGLVSETDTAEITFPGRPGSAAPVPVAESPVPLVVGGVVALAVLAALGTWVVVDRRRRGATAAAPASS